MKNLWLKLIYLIFIFVVIVVSVIVYNTYLLPINTDTTKEYFEKLSNDEVIDIYRDLEFLNVTKFDNVNEIELKEIFNLYASTKEIQDKISLGEDILIPANDFKRYVKDTFYGYVIKESDFSEQFQTERYIYIPETDSIKLSTMNNGVLWPTDISAQITIKDIKYHNDVVTITYRYENNINVTRNDIITIKVNANNYQYISYDFEYISTDAINQVLTDWFSVYLNDNANKFKKLLEFEIDNIHIYSNNPEITGKIDYTVKPYTFDNSEWLAIGTKDGDYIHITEYFKLISIENSLKIEDFSTTPYREIINANIDPSKQLLYNGFPIQSKIGVQYANEITKPQYTTFNTNYSLKDFVRTYYNYENSQYKNITIGEIEQVYEDSFRINNVSKIAIPYQTNAIPRPVIFNNVLPDVINQSNKKLPKYTQIDVATIDLDGDTTNEYIVTYIDKNNVNSQIDLYDNNGKLIDHLVILEKGYWANIQSSEYEIYITKENIDIIDIDNDNVMEIIIQIPIYEGIQISILKYSNGVLDGITNIVPNLKA